MNKITLRRVTVELVTVDIDVDKSAEECSGIAKIACDCLNNGLQLSVDDGKPLEWVKISVVHMIAP